MLFLRFFKWNVVPLPKDLLLWIGVHESCVSVTCLDATKLKPEAFLLSLVMKEMYTTTFNKYAGTFSSNEIDRWKTSGEHYAEQGDPLAYGHAFEDVLQSKYPGYIQQLPDYEQQERDKDVQ